MIELVGEAEARETLRTDILARISQNPFCPIAALLADALYDLD